MKAVRFVIRTGSPAILQLLKGLLSNYEIVLNAHHENSITIMNCQQKEFSTSFNNEISQTSQISRAQSPHQSFPLFCSQCFPQFHSTIQEWFQLSQHWFLSVVSPFLPWKKFVDVKETSPCCLESQSPHNNHGDISRHQWGQILMLAI